MFQRMRHRRWTNGFACRFLFASGLLMATGNLLAQSQRGDRGVPQEILNLDLCTLAYQLYHQSLILPLDPWYDQFSRVGSDRRDNICRYSREYASLLGRGGGVGSAAAKGFYAGPSAARGWTGGNADLDPILTNYKLLHPALPSLMWDGTAYVATLAPAYLTSSLKTIEGVRYKAKPTAYPSDNTERFTIRELNRNGGDHLFVFEGGTGAVEKTEPAWGLMGLVLLRKTPTGSDLHIVFRGSRGGSVGRTVLQAQGVIGVPKGNPDWVTDLSSTRQVVRPVISQAGKVTQGFGTALPTMLGPIKSCCKFIQDNYPAPKKIYVTGHSLGAALASQFTSAVLMGSFGGEIKSEFADWPWDQTQLIAFAQPIPGDPTWASHFNQRSPQSQHYWVAGDAVVEGTSTLLGRLIDEGAHCGVQNELIKPDHCPDDSHEVFVIRGALLRDLSRKATIPQSIARVSTWGYYDSFNQMLSGQGKNYVYPGASSPSLVTPQNLRSVLSRGNFGPEFARWLEEVYAKMIADRSSYIGPSFPRTLTNRKKQVDQVVVQMRKERSSNKKQLLDDLENDFRIVDDQLGTSSEEKWIFLGMVLNAFQNSTLTLEDLQSRPVIKQCMEGN